MDGTKSASNGPNRPAEESEMGRTPDALPSITLVAPFVRLAVENTQTMLNLQRALADLGRDLFRQQQDAMMAAMLRGFSSNAAQDRVSPQGDLAGVARLGFQAFERMAAALRASNDPSRWTGMRGTSPGQQR